MISWLFVNKMHIYSQKYIVVFLENDVSYQKLLFYTSYLHFPSDCLVILDVNLHFKLWISISYNMNLLVRLELFQLVIELKAYS